MSKTSTMSKQNSISAITDEFVEYRHALHENPQTSYEEEFASNLVAEKLNEWGIPFEENIATTGIVATIEGQKTSSGDAIALRADMDALDIEEQTDLPWASKISGKMHACGHDGHTTTLLATAKYLNETKNYNGSVHLIFQPAEEGGRGAHKMIEEGLFERFPCDAIYAFHNWPSLPKGQIAMRPGPMLASSDGFIIDIAAQGGHAAMPHQTRDPVLIASQLASALQTLISRETDPLKSAVLSVTNLDAGTGAFNVIADSAKLTGTVRTFDQEVRNHIEKRISEVAENLTTAFGATATVEYERGLEPTINDEKAIDLCTQAASQVVGEDNVDTAFGPSMGAEDFGAFLTEKPGAFVMIGQGEQKVPDSPHNQGLHTPLYDFNDNILPVATEYFVELVETSLPLQK